MAHKFTFTFFVLNLKLKCLWNEDIILTNLDDNGVRTTLLLAGVIDHIPVSGLGLRRRLAISKSQKTLLSNVACQMNVKGHGIR